jgi:hypothetical protein
MEDAMIINKSSMERGFGHGTLHKTEVVDLKEDKSGAMLFAAEPLRRGETVAVQSYEGAFGATLPRNVPSIEGESTCVTGPLNISALDIHSPSRRTHCLQGVHVSYS